MMRVAVVTPFFDTRQDWLERCHQSVREQTHPCTHFLISDGSGENPLDGFTGQFLKLPKSHGDFGGTPRAAGSMMAVGQGYDAIAFLDSDNFFLPDHIASLVSLQHQTKALICSSARTLCTLDGTPLGRCIEVDGQHFADTNCMFLTRAAYGVLNEWVLMPRDYSIVGDFWVWSTIRSLGLSRAHSGLATLNYRTSFPHHYRRNGKIPPVTHKDAKFLGTCDERIRNLPLHFGDAAASLHHVLPQYRNSSAGEEKLQPERGSAPTMPARERSALADFLSQSRCYLEFGAGQSTLMAATSNVEWLLCVESSLDWLRAIRAQMQASAPARKAMWIHADIGATGDWGYPRDRSAIERWPSYFLGAWTQLLGRGLSPDLILIDGRFRVACFAASLIHARPGTAILFDDYEDRPHYHAVETLLNPTAMHGRMAEFRVAIADQSRALSLLAQHLFDAR